MMLTKEDLQAISELINGAVSASEERMIAQIAASENRVMAYIEKEKKKEKMRKNKTIFVMFQCILS